MTGNNANVGLYAGIGGGLIILIIIIVIILVFLRRCVLRGSNRILFMFLLKAQRPESQTGESANPVSPIGNFGILW